MRNTSVTLMLILSTILSAQGVFETETVAKVAKEYIISKITKNKNTPFYVFYSSNHKYRHIRTNKEVYHGSKKEMVLYLEGLKDFFMNNSEGTSKKYFGKYIDAAKKGKDGRIFFDDGFNRIKVKYINKLLESLK